METLRIVLADDHAILREGLKVLINAETDMCVVGEADCGTAAVEQTRTCQPNVVVMDISMPGSNGLRATQQIKQLSPSTRILVLTRHDEPVYLRQLLEA